MPTIAVSFHLGVLSDTFGNDLRAKTGWKVCTASKMEQLLTECRCCHPDVVLMEVAQTPPWDTASCLELVAKIRAELPNAKFVFWCDERPGQIGEQVIKAKKEGKIDAFLYASADLEFFAATIKTLLPEMTETI